MIIILLLKNSPVKPSSEKPLLIEADSDIPFTKGLTYFANRRVYI